jgi:hypothetical protein
MKDRAIAEEVNFEKMVLVVAVHTVGHEPWFGYWNLV